MRATCTRTIEELARDDDRIYLMTADLGYKRFDAFDQAYPGRFINVGVAEANMISIAAGLALEGKIVFCYSIAPFLVMRTLEQIRVDLCYHRANVNLLGAGGGLAYGLEGMTHHAIEDLALLRSLPNMTVTAPGDVCEAEAIVKAARDHEGPVYIRMGADREEPMHPSVPELRLGQGLVLREGGDAALVTTGSMLRTADKVCERLAARGIACALVSMPTVKPLDCELILARVAPSPAVFTLEEHSIVGGLGTAVAEALIEAGYSGRFRRIGLPDQYAPFVGHVQYLRQRHGLVDEAVADRILSELDAA